MLKGSLLAAALVVLLAISAHALTGKNGYEATSLFDEDDLRYSVSYPSGFSGIEWADLAGNFGLGKSGTGATPVLAADAAGGLFLRVFGGNLDGCAYTGVVHWDGTDFHHLVQDVHSDADGGCQVEGVTVSPVSSGLLSEGHPVISRLVVSSTGDYWTDLVSIDPETADETLVYRAGSGTRIRHLAVDSGGCIYGLAGSDLLAVARDGDAYAAETLATGVGGALALGGDGALYTFAADASWGGGRGENALLRVDPATGTVAAYAAVPCKYALTGGLTADSDGSLFIGLAFMKKSNGSIALVRAGETVSAGDVVAEVENYSLLRAIAGGPDGALHVVETLSVAAEEMAVTRLDPGSGDSGGGGNGGGKGKNK